MKITIDTKEDTHDEIKKAISMLTALVEGHSLSSPSSYSPMSMFSDSSSGASPSPESSSEPAAQPGIFSIFNDDKKEEETESQATSHEKPEQDSNDEEDEGSFQITTY